MDTKDASLVVEWIPIDQVFPNPANPRLNEQAVGPVAESIRRFGWQQPIVAKPSGEVVAGNTRLKAAEELGLERVPVVRFEGSEIDALAFAIADNKLGEIANWEEEGLRKILAHLAQEDALEGVGYTPDEVALLLESESEPEGAVEDAEPAALPTVPVSQGGDLWLLGPHRVLCGDSTQRADMERLVGERQVDFVWTDPPYGVAYVGKTDEALELQNDELDENSLERLLFESFDNALRFCRPGAVWYVAAPAGPNLFPFAKVLKDLGVWRQLLIWVKDAFVLGRSDFHYRHEAIFYGWKPGAAHQEPPARTYDTVWEVPRPKASRDHPTMKPVELVARALRLSSSRDSVVLDPFLGSGTTLVAAEDTGRTCLGLEIDPRYVDVIVRRWEELTGKDAVLEGIGESFSKVAVARGRQADK